MAHEAVAHPRGRGPHRRVGGVIAIVGPWVAPYGSAEFVGTANVREVPGTWLGTDYFGQDVWSWFLHGGRSILFLASVSTLIGFVFGAAIGMVAAYNRGPLDDLLMRFMDILLAFPQLLLALVALTTVGPKSWLIIVIVGFTTIPRIARITRGATVPVVERELHWRCRSARRVKVPDHHPRTAPQRHGPPARRLSLLFVLPARMSVTMKAACGLTTCLPAGGTYGVDDVLAVRVLDRQDRRVADRLAAVGERPVGRHEVDRPDLLDAEGEGQLGGPRSPWKSIPNSWALAKTWSVPLMAIALTAGMLSENWRALRTRTGPRSRRSASFGV